MKKRTGNDRTNSRVLVNFSFVSFPSTIPSQSIFMVQKNTNHMFVDIFVDPRSNLIFPEYTIKKHIFPQRAPDFLNDF